MIWKSFSKMKCIQGTYTVVGASNRCRSVRVWLKKRRSGVGRNRKQNGFWESEWVSWTDGLPYIGVYWYSRGCSSSLPRVYGFRALLACFPSYDGSMELLVRSSRCCNTAFRFSLSARRADCYPSSLQLLDFFSFFFLSFSDWLTSWLMVGWLIVTDSIRERTVIFQIFFSCWIFFFLLIVFFVANFSRVRLFCDMRSHQVGSHVCPYDRSVGRSVIRSLRAGLLCGRGVARAGGGREGGGAYSHFVMGVY